MPLANKVTKHAQAIIQSQREGKSAGVIHEDGFSGAGVRSLWSRAKNIAGAAVNVVRPLERDRETTTNLNKREGECF